MSDREPEAIDTLHALIADSTIAEAEAYWRAAERLKVIAELEGDRARDWLAWDRHGSPFCLLSRDEQEGVDRSLAALGLLMSPGGGNDKDLLADSSADKSAISADRPSPEQAREGDEGPWVNGVFEFLLPLRAPVEAPRHVKGDELGELFGELCDALPESFASAVGSARWEDMPAHEEGSTNGTS